jgi:DNA-binding GntR family transcriptional regulator
MPVVAGRHVTMRERTYEALVELITSGELPSGAAIDERELTAQLESSRTPFREAIGALAKDGLVEIRPYRGFFVRQLTVDEANNLYELRKVLEAFAVRLAVHHISDADIAEIAAMLDAAIACLAASDMAGYARHDRAFHDRIAALSGNHALIESLARLGLQIQLCRVLANRDTAFAERATLERDEILLALRRRDADRASELMVAHISDVQNSVMAQLAALEGERIAHAARRRLVRT